MSPPSAKNMSESVNPKLHAIEGFFKEVVWDTALKAALASLFIQAPYLAVWPIKQIITGLVGWISDVLFSKIKLLIDLQAIVILNEKHRREYTIAVLNLRAIADTNGIDSAEFKEARENAKKHLSKFIHFNG